MLDHDRFPLLCLYYRSIHIAPVIFGSIGIPKRILFSQFLSFLFHLKISRRQGSQVIHLIPSVDIKNLADWPKAVCRVEIPISEIFLKSPHALITFFLGKIERKQVMDISSFHMQNLPEKSLSGHFQGHNFKEIVAAVFQLHAMLLGSLRSFDQLPALIEGAGSRHFYCCMLARFHSKNCHWDVPFPRRGNVNQIQIWPLAHFFPGIGTS